MNPFSRRRAEPRIDRSRRHHPAFASEVFPRTPTGKGERLPDTASAPVDGPKRESRPSFEHGAHGPEAAAAVGASRTPADATGPTAPFLPAAGGLIAAWITLLVLIGRRRARTSAEARNTDTGEEVASSVRAP
jgi:hypothetical protein